MFSDLPRGFSNVSFSNVVISQVRKKVLLLSHLLKVIGKFGEYLNHHQAYTYNLRCSIFNTEKVDCTFTTLAVVSFYSRTKIKKLDGDQLNTFWKVK